MIDDARWMQRAMACARQAAACGEVPVGAVVVRDGQVIGEAHNRPVHSHDPTAHAEILALRQAATRLGNYRLPDCTLYVTLEPCLMCVGAMIHARIAALVYAAPDPKVGAVNLAAELTARHALNHALEVRSGVLDADAAELLKDYFRGKRGRPDD